MLEALISIAIFAIFLSAIGMSMILGERSTVAGGDRTHAVFLAEQNIEVARSLRDQDFALLTSGTFHPVVGTGGTWQLETGPVITSGGYVTQLAIASLGDDWFEATSTVGWDFGKTRSGTVVLQTYLTNWREPLAVGNWSAMHEEAEIASAGADYQKIALTTSHAYVTGINSSSGVGLSIFDISDPALPVRIAPGFDLGHSAYGVLVEGTSLYVATDDPSAEIKVYDITAPANLDPSHLSGSYDLPGSGYARSLAYFGSTLFAGTTEQASDAELFALGITSTGVLFFLDSLEIGGGVSDISLHNGYAYLASSSDSGELQVVDVFDPTDLVFVPGVGMDLPDVFDGSVAAAFGTSAILGRTEGSAIDEVILYSIAESPLPSPPPGPWTVDIGGDARDFSVEPGGTYGFVAGNVAGGQLRILSIPAFASGQNPILFTYNAGQAVNGVAYHWQTDRLFAAGYSSFFVFAPGP